MATRKLTLGGRTYTVGKTTTPKANPYAIKINTTKPVKKKLVKKPPVNQVITLTKKEMAPPPPTQQAVVHGKTLPLSKHAIDYYNKIGVKVSQPKPPEKTTQTTTTSPDFITSMGGGNFTFLDQPKTTYEETFDKYGAETMEKLANQTYYPAETTTVTDPSRQHTTASPTYEGATSSGFSVMSILPFALVGIVLIVILLLLRRRN